MKRELTIEEQNQIVTGAIAIAAVIVYKIFLSKEGSTTIPGGWKFTWE